ncbi:CAP domain protein [Ophiocordyceps sinensis CO18]|nr:CAP domain protein [Ophiocordyceps sinensis CO18]
MEYDAALEAAAQQWADKCAADGKMSHAGMDNIWAGHGPQYTGDDFLTNAVVSWYEEEPIYEARIGYQEPTKAQHEIAFGPAATEHDMWGHFTMLVWKASTRLGCAKSARTDSAGAFYVVCRFETGNVQGQYAQNVKPKGSRS